MRIALFSRDQKWLDKEENFASCKKITQEAANNGCNLLIFRDDANRVFT
jgi:predicted amidohydrolase